MKRSLTALAFATHALLAAAQTYSFDCITDTSGTNCAAGESQLSVILSGPTASQALFTFANVGGAALSLTDVYFDDGSLLGIASITNGSGVSFSQGASPPDLPGGNAVSFNVTQGFSADSDPPTQPNGVNPGESLAILFDLQAGKTFADVSADLGSGALRIGVHVQGYANGGSESFVNLASPVPETGTAVLAISGLGLLGLARRRRSNAERRMSISPSQTA